MGVKRKKQPARRAKAATADVIGDQPRPGRVPSKWKEHHRRLMELRNYVLHQRDDLSRDAAEEQPAFSLHLADVSTDNFDRDFALSRISAEQDAVYEIDNALTRIREGAYGICELTGKPIDRARLEAIPWTRFSVEAERMLEREGSVTRARLAPREPVERGVTARGEAEEDGEEEE
jgi:DnaK suppressor protein